MPIDAIQQKRSLLVRHVLKKVIWFILCTASGRVDIIEVKCDQFNTHYVLI